MLRFRKGTIIEKNTVRERKSKIHVLRRIRLVLILLGHTYVRILMILHLQPLMDHQKIAIGLRSSMLIGNSGVKRAM